MTDPTPMASPPAAPQIPPRPSRPGEWWSQALAVAAGICLAAAAVGAVLLMLRLVNVLVIPFLSVLIAATVARPVRALERRRMPPAIAISVVYLLVLGVLGLVIVLVIPPLISQIAGVGWQLPELLERYQELRRLYESLRQQYPELRPFEQEIGGLGGQLLSGIGASLSRLPQRLFGLAFDVLSVMFISTLLVVRRQELLRAVLDLTPPEHRERMRAVLTAIWVRLKQDLGAKLTVMLIVGTLTYLALWLIGVLSPLLLAVIVALCEIIPRVGTWLARKPLFILAATAGWLALGLTIASSVAIQNFKGLVISPFIEGSQLDLHPLLACLSVLIGAALLGVAGAALAIPAAAAIQVIAEAIVLPWYRGWLAPTEPEGSS
jgi:predicted PurR-regulated permease PerM